MEPSDLDPGKSQVSPDRSLFEHDAREGQTALSRSGRSSRSTRSGRSSASTASTLAAKARADAAAARTRAAFVKKEAVVKLERAKLDAELEVLRLEAEAAAAEAQADVLEAVAQEREEHHICRAASQGSEDRAQRTLDFVLQQATVQTGPHWIPPEQQGGEHRGLSAATDAPGERAQRTPASTINQGPAQAGCYPQTAEQRQRLNLTTVGEAHEFRAGRIPDSALNLSPSQSGLTPTPLEQHGRERLDIATGHANPHGRYDRGSPPHIGLHRRQQEPVPHTEMDAMAKYLVRRDLVSSVLVQFDDRPENYRSWRSTFQGMTQSLDLNANEELDLLVKWLGVESSGYAKRLRSVHVANPEAGLRLVWERLEECYGRPEVIEDSLFKRVANFPRLSDKDTHKLRELGDLLLELECAKADPHLTGLSYLDTARGILPIVEKLPPRLQEAWISKGSRYKQDRGVAFPPFAFFAEFVRSQAKMRNDPSFTLSSANGAVSKHEGNRKTSIAVHVTDVDLGSETSSRDGKKMASSTKYCPLHKKPHPLQKCRAFREKPLDERKSLLKQFGLCFKCCTATDHFAKDCKVVVTCADCGSGKHATALHQKSPSSVPSDSKQGAKIDEPNPDLQSPKVSSTCTEVCGRGCAGRSCSKICLVDVSHTSEPQTKVRMYAILDDQSNRSLARSEFFDLFGLNGQSITYTLKTCSGVEETSGRRASGFFVEGVKGGEKLPLPTLIECNKLPDNRSEIPTPQAARNQAHLKDIAEQIPSLDPNAEILLLLGRDILRVHKVRQQRNGPADSPFAQKLDLGWVIVGDVCIDRQRTSDCVSNFKTNILVNGRPSFMKPCSNHFHVKENLSAKSNKTRTSQLVLHSSSIQDCYGDVSDTLFEVTEDDNQPSLSMEDRKFLKIMDAESFKNESGNWVAPLPFRSPRPRLPNKKLAQTRLATLKRTLQKKPEALKSFIAFMEKMFENGHAKEAPPLAEGEECWYLPIFGVCHPQKPGETKVVFDSSAQYENTSLNSVLLTGPDFTNSLLGVLIRFRKDLIAVTADIQQMFYCFSVREDHRNYLRFLWFRNNDIQNEVVEYRMTVHVFGNSPSPAVANYALRRTAREGEEEFGKDARQFVERDFYVDDGLKSLPTEREAISLLRRTQKMLGASNLRLHKFASNSPAVMEAFPKADRAKDLKDLDLSVDAPPIQRSLGVYWDLRRDVFTFRVPKQERPFTRRGVLSTVNSLYDPLGFAAPVTIKGRSLLRELVTDTCDWDAPLPDEKRKEWEDWKDSLKALENLRVPRTYVPASLSAVKRREAHIFSDASNKAVAAVSYLRITDDNGACHLGFMMAKSKLAPRPEHTVPRLELCGAVLAVELAELIQREMDIALDSVDFYCDSKVVLGYIHNETRRFYVYVSNRVQRIRRSIRPDQWHYVPTNINPADLGTRFLPASKLQESGWLTGPEFLRRREECLEILQGRFELVSPDRDANVRPQATSLATTVSMRGLNASRFERFSSWTCLICAIAVLVRVASNFHGGRSVQDNGPFSFTRPSAEHVVRAKAVVIRSVQREAFSEELKCLDQGKHIAKLSPLRKLDPWVDPNGLLKIGGRLGKAQWSQDESKPIIIPGNHHVAMLLIRHYQEEVKHQGRHFTEGAIRAAGFWIVGAKRRISSYIQNCVTCRKLRGKQQEQKMADLPTERLSTEPPFTYVGLDVFGPWQVTARRTRGGEAHNKRWAVLFTCMSVRAVHIEVMESMDASSFINALRRFFAIRGPAKQLRSDCGTNFVGACSELQLNVGGQNSERVNTFLSNLGCTWVFNPPHASHMGGVWERMIGIARRILDSMLLEHSPGRLTHEVLTTFLAEVTAIINARPLVPVSTDVECWDILTPAMLLTQKTGANTLAPGLFDCKDLHRRQWRQVQWFADGFWNRWRRDFLTTLQSRRKWHSPRRNSRCGDLVLLKDKNVCRNEWPMARVVKTFPSADGKVRKVEVKTATGGVVKTFSRPVTETVLLIAHED